MRNSTTMLGIAELRAKVHEQEHLSEQSARRFDEVLGRFELFVQRGFGVNGIEGLEPLHVEAFVRASAPSVATMHLRRSALRLLFRLVRQLTAYDHDLTLDLTLPPRSSLAMRPLTNDEIEVGRSYSLRTLTATRQPAAWALAEATATTSELPHITIDDLHLENAKVWLHGGSKNIARWGELTGWGVLQLQRRVSTLRNERWLVYQGNGSPEAKQISCCVAINETLTRCGLALEPDVRPSSIAAWAGRRVYEETNSIEEVACRLGMRSLDRAARFIAHDWHE